jgi:hypothetical protein
MTEALQCTASVWLLTVRFPLPAHVHLMLFRPTTRTSILASATVFDVFGVQVGRVLEVEPERILIGSNMDQPLIWVKKKAILATTKDGILLSCARNRLHFFAD